MTYCRHCSPATVKKFEGGLSSKDLAIEMQRTDRKMRLEMSSYWHLCCVLIRSCHLLGCAVLSENSFWQNGTIFSIF